MSGDVDYARRLELLQELMEKNPQTPVRKLLRECLKYYPLHSQEAQRRWMSIDTAFKAADLTCHKVLDAMEEAAGLNRLSEDEQQYLEKTA